jgi:hypothetical protein
MPKIALARYKIAVRRREIFRAAILHVNATSFINLHAYFTQWNKNKANQ